MVLPVGRDAFPDDEAWRDLEDMASTKGSNVMLGEKLLNILSGCDASRAADGALVTSIVATEHAGKAGTTAWQSKS